MVEQEICVPDCMGINLVSDELISLWYTAFNMSFCFPIQGKSAFRRLSVGLIIVSTSLFTQRSEYWDFVGRRRRH